MTKFSKYEIRLLRAIKSFNNTATALQIQDYLVENPTASLFSWINSGTNLAVIYGGLKSLSDKHVLTVVEEPGFWERGGRNKLIFSIKPEFLKRVP